MPRHLGIRKRKELKGGSVSNIDKLAEDFAKHVQFGKADDKSLSPDKIKKKFSI